MQPGTPRQTFVIAPTLEQLHCVPLRVQLPPLKPAGHHWHRELRKQAWSPRPVHPACTEAAAMAATHTTARTIARAASIAEGEGGEPLTCCETGSVTARLHAAVK